MIMYVFRPKRRKGGKPEARRLYRGRYQLSGESVVTDIPLHTTDKQVAEKKLEEIVREKQRELAGIIIPRASRDAASRPLVQHLADFKSDLETRKRDEMYVYNLDKRIRKMCAGCAWVYARDITADSFIAWRSKQKKAAKTLNDYLDAITAFLNWMQQHERISMNPLRTVGKVETAGNELRRRRALGEKDLRKLLGVAGARMPVYLAAVHTGLRRAELQSLQWGDVHLDAVRPYFEVRASTTKNHKTAVIWLHRDVVATLPRIRPSNGTPTDLVFTEIPNMDQYRADLKAAGIAYRDTQGRQSDFHALRCAFGTNLFRAGVSPRVAMELMRHSDMRLTAKTYTDVNQLPTAEAVDLVPSLLDGDPETGSQIGSQKVVSIGRCVSSHVAGGAGTKVQKASVKSGESRIVTFPVAESHEEEVGCRTRIRT